MPLFEVAIIRKPTKKERDEGEGETLVLAPTAVLAHDGQGAAVKATRQAEGLPENLDNIDVLVRPFA